MNLLITTDTHGHLHQYIDQIPFNSADLIVLCGDNYTEDLELIKNIKIPKIGVLGNNNPRVNTGKTIDIFKEYNIVNLHGQKFQFQGLNFYGVEGEPALIWQDQQPTWKSAFFNKLHQQTNIDILVSHFGAKHTIKEPRFTHQGLENISQFITAKQPAYFLHGHLHKNIETVLGETQVVLSYPWRLLEVGKK